MPKRAYELFPALKYKNEGLDDIVLPLQHQFLSSLKTEVHKKIWNTAGVGMFGLGGKPPSTILKLRKMFTQCEYIDSYIINGDKQKFNTDYTGLARSPDRTYLMGVAESLEFHFAEMGHLLVKKANEFKDVQDEKLNDQQKLYRERANEFLSAFVDRPKPSATNQPG